MSMLLFIGAPEIFVIVVFILIFFGSKQIPTFARLLGKGMNEFRRATEDIKREITDTKKEFDDELDDFKNKIS
jgi:sec-independent protein translocase protein TatA